MLAEKVSKMTCGNGLEGNFSIGPLINQKGLDKVASHVNDSVALGAKILVGGPVDSSVNASGASFYKPTILVNMTADMTPFRYK